jgi:hypothetical protein
MQPAGSLRIRPGIRIELMRRPVTAVLDRPERPEAPAPHWLASILQRNIECLLSVRSLNNVRRPPKAIGLSKPEGVGRADQFGEFGQRSGEE